MKMNTGPKIGYTVIVRGAPKAFGGPVAAANYAAARILEGESDVSYSVTGYTTTVRQQREAALIARVEKILAYKGKTL
jgi:hypothetical protein